VVKKSFSTLINSMRTLITLSLAFSFVFVANACQRSATKQQEKQPYQQVTVPEPKPAGDVNFSTESKKVP
jgi:hypothetical protein